MNLQERIKVVTQYGKNLLYYRPKYGWWRGGSIPIGPPAFAKVGLPPLPRNVHNIFCQGIPNLMLRKVGKAPPMRRDGAGGRGGIGAAIGFWYKGKFWEGVYFKAAQPYRYGMQLYEGDLLYRVYRNVVDQGHVAYVLEDGTNPTLLQSQPSKGSLEPGVHNNLKVYNQRYYYHYVVRAKDWLM